MTAVYFVVAVLWATLIMLTGIPGNTLILYVYARKRSRTSAHVFILALATCDLFACLILPLNMYNWTHEFTFVNEKLCKATLSTSFLRCYIGLFLTGALSVDRYCVVCNPRKRFSINQARTVVAVCAFFAAVISLPSIAIFGIRRDTENDGKSSCDILGPVWTKDIFYTFEMVCYILIFTMILVLFILLFVGACKSRQKAISRESLKTSASVQLAKSQHSVNDTSVPKSNRPSRLPRPIKVKPQDDLVTGVPLMSDIDIITASIPSRPPSHQLPPVCPSHPNALPELEPMHMPSRLPDMPAGQRGQSSSTCMIHQQRLPSIPEIPGTVIQQPLQTSRHGVHHSHSIPSSSRTSRPGSTLSVGISRASMISPEGARHRKLLSTLSRMLVITCLVTMVTWIPTIVVFMIPYLTEPLRSTDKNLYIVVVWGRHFELFSYSIKAGLYAALNRHFYREASEIWRKIVNCLC